MSDGAPSAQALDGADTVTLYLMTRKGLESLQAAVGKHRHQISSVVVGSDPNSVRDYSSEIRDLCMMQDLPVFERTDESIPRAKFAIAVSWRWMVPLDSTQLIVLHDSILPRYRGFNPLVSALINGEKEVGVTAFMASKEYDRGDIIDVEKIPIEYPLKIAEAIDSVALCYGKIVSRVFQMIEDRVAFERTPQKEEEASYSLWRDQDDYRIDWDRSAEYIKRFIDATGFPYKGSKTLMNGRTVRLLDADPIDDVRIENRTPGKTIFVEEGKPVVVCGSGLLVVNDLVDDESGESLLPLRSLRTRFQ